MKPSDQTMIHFYQHLGKVFYCIAAIDKTVRTEEIERLKKIIKTEWIPLEGTVTEFGDDAAYQIEIIFDWLMENEWDLEQVIPNFKIFRKEHQSLFTPEIRILILKTAIAIVTAFSGENKSEHLIISQLTSILQP
ncbi:hypothetical protein [Flavobacterium acetivorans]|uniref:hypothetical protein n=1 Tax=Flavobacterium acetivorans TaxID=2893883 RepID=UPI001E45EAFA|nr:hypothetical protein [Flavobacterium sp. F-29]UFH36363.1 hypothetical protein LNP19_04795 [Flavobacterium sp. F-29]